MNIIMAGDIQHAYGMSQDQVRRQAIPWQGKVGNRNCISPPAFLAFVMRLHDEHPLREGEGLNNLFWGDSEEVDVAALVNEAVETGKLPTAIDNPLLALDVAKAAASMAQVNKANAEIEAKSKEMVDIEHLGGLALFALHVLQQELGDSYDDAILGAGNDRGKLRDVKSRLLETVQRRLTHAAIEAEAQVKGGNPVRAFDIKKG